MLKNLTLTNFTAFSKAELNFSKGINVIIGRNGVGKSHLLRAGYAALSTVYEGSKIPTEQVENQNLTFPLKILNVFKVLGASSLIRKSQGSTQKAKIELQATDCEDNPYLYKMDIKPGNKMHEASSIPKFKKHIQPVYITPKEIISIYPGLIQAIEDRELSFDDTYYDLAKALGRSPLKGKRLEEISDILTTIENDVFDGGKFVEKNNRFYFEKESIGELEAPLVAEGLCKVGMLAHLLRNGSLVKGSTLFWDEPESNLNPQLLKLVAKAMTSLADYGIQVVVATHSLFLMRELDILSKNKSTPLRFFGLSETPTGVEVSQGDSIENIDHIQSLEEELEQTDRYLSLEYVDD
ncbi:AAA family ATPase [Maridesulfovibrio sp.]|uniref:AAA family ATPase n=1 Tax=unclassified Maridesulfovibrio TaxID=2794999 RepID=UPI003AFFA091